MRVKEIRKKLRLTQEQLAEALGYQRSETVSDWERGERNPSPEALEAIAELASMSYAEAFGAYASPGESITVEGGAQDYVAKIIDPQVLRRMAGTPGVRDVVIAVKAVLVGKPWPVEIKK